jgi:hypothetical protein
MGRRQPRRRVTAVAVWFFQGMRLFTLAGSCVFLRGFFLTQRAWRVGSLWATKKIAAGPQQPQSQVLRGERAGYVNNPPRLQSYLQQ